MFYLMTNNTFLPTVTDSIRHLIMAKSSVDQLTGFSSRLSTQQMGAVPLDYISLQPEQCRISDYKAVNYVP